MKVSIVIVNKQAGASSCLLCYCCNLKKKYS